MLLECEGDALDLSGDMGAVGRFSVCPGRVPIGDELLLDLKGKIRVQIMLFPDSIVWFFSCHIMILLSKHLLYGKDYTSCLFLNLKYLNIKLCLLVVQVSFTRQQ